MIPQFPEFKKLELSDKDEVESFTKKFPPYSDFNFVSMWSWDIKDEMALSCLNGNLVLKFTDYLTGDPFYTFIGVNEVDETAASLMTLADKEEIDDVIHLIPEDVVKHINKTEKSLSVHENIDHHDYVYSLEELVNYEGSALKTQRNTLGSFLRKYPTYEAKIIDLHDNEMQQAILRLYKIWEVNMNTSVPHEFLALKKCLVYSGRMPVFGIGIFIDGVLVGFNINQIDSQDFATCFFAKGDVNHYGIYCALMNETAKILVNNYGVKYFNYEQDLGLFSLRKSKKAFNPVYFLKKYSVSRASD